MTAPEPEGVTLGSAARNRAALLEPVSSRRWGATEELKAMTGIRTLGYFVALGALATGCLDHADPRELGVEDTASVAQALTGPVTVERVQTCVAGACTTASEYSAWNTHGVAGSVQQGTMIARVTEPSVQDVENVVLVLAGQQKLGGFVYGGTSNGLTGQPSSWRSTFESNAALASAEFSIASDSLISRAVDAGYFDLARSFVALGFDAGFDYETDAASKDAVEQAYYAWLLSNFNPAKLKSVYLAGHSRGGCLALRLGKRFNADFPGKKLVVHAFDPVCNPDQAEFGVSTSPVQDPVDAAESAYSSDIVTQFGSPGARTSVLSFVTGGTVSFSTVRGMSQQGATTQTTDLGWFVQHWTDAGVNHNNVDNPAAPADAAFVDLGEKLTATDAATPPGSATASLYLPLDNSFGTQVPDAAGGSATLVGSSSNLLVTGAINRGYQLGGQRHVSVADSADVDLGTGDFSVLAWVKPSTASLQTILDKRTYSGGRYLGYHLMVWGSKLLFQMATPERNWVNFYNAGPAINDCRWHLVAVTVDRDDATGGKMFVDGNLIQTFNPLGLAGSLDNGAALLIGKHQFGGAAFGGSVDEVVIQKSVLSADEIRGHYDALASTLPPQGC